MEWKYFTNFFFLFPFFSFANKQRFLRTSAYFERRKKNHIHVNGTFLISAKEEKPALSVRIICSNWVADSGIFFGIQGMSFVIVMPKLYPRYWIFSFRWLITILAQNVNFHGSDVIRNERSKTQINISLPLKDIQASQFDGTRCKNRQSCTWRYRISLYHLRSWVWREETAETAVSLFGILARPLFIPAARFCCVGMKEILKSW